jgi:hypothetical protein
MSLVRQTGQPANPQADLEDLLELLLNPDIRELHRSLRLAAEPAGGAVPAAATGPVKPPQGQTLRALSAVLEQHPAGLMAKEAHQLVEQRLRRSIQIHTIRATLAAHPELFERIRRGFYRSLRD